MIGRLPTKVAVGDIEWDIRTDYRDILTIFCAFNDPELNTEEKVIVCLTIFYIDFDKLNPSLYKEAYERAIWFFNQGKNQEDKHSPKLLDWEQDESLIFSEVNKVAGMEVRNLEYMHWWTFMGYYMGIGEGLFSEVLNIRSKKAKNKKLEKHEKEFYAQNKSLIDLKIKLSEEEKEAQKELEELLGL
ncbi:MAG: hypothetical protein E7254_02630 [Lachnospiraceae bacterium]|nr:hypothetical protein [Lachnospiraceae bacterium]